METDLVRRIADAVLYEGYLLWPYRKSALKNQQRFTFGGVYPPAWDDRSSMRVQVLLEDSERAQVEVRVRFLQVVRRQVLRSGADGEATEPVEELEAGGERWVSWDEVVEREVGPGAIEVEAGEALEEVPGGAVRRSWRGLRGEVSLERERVRPGLWRVSVKITNTTPWASGSKRGAAAEHTSPAIGAPVAGEGRNEREDALRQTFCSTHAVLRASGGGRWVSQTDPPTGVRAEAEACENDGVWPVLVGEEDDRSTLLASPIILCDYPEIAPESPGELFDSGEIDQMLVLNILAMTDEERREMRDSDPRARAILERTEALSNEEIMRLHGAVREFGLVRAR
ncbi:MAG TPA: hypothetical protein VLJ42_00630 [Solirubrobacteraceae bacterium]|nr:hypothetical protein [Solirubrobacteraceae bacterium]